MKPFLLTVVLLSGSCAATPPRQRPFHEVVDSSDGISRVEANWIANRYFFRYISSCGRPDPVRLDGEHWESIAYVGPAPIPLDDPIRVNARTGAASGPRGPLVEAWTLWVDPSNWPAGRLTIEEVDRSDGIDEDEAWALAYRHYLTLHLGYDGFGEAEREGAYWKFVVLWHYEGPPLGEPIRVHALTGAVSGPVYDYVWLRESEIWVRKLIIGGSGR